MKIKLFLTALALAAASAGAGASHRPLTPLVNRHGDAPTKFETALQEPAAMVKAAAEGNVQIQIGVQLDGNNGEELSALFAVGVDNPAMYVATQSFGSLWTLSVPPGKYDVIATAIGDTNSSYTVLFYENQVFEQNGNMVVSSGDAKLSTKIKHLSPGGDDIVFPRRGEPGNCTTGDLWMMLRHNDYGTVLADEMATLSEAVGTIKTNVVPQHYSLTRMDALTWRESPVFMVIPIDMNLDVNQPDMDNWCITRRTFAKTPINKVHDELNKDEIPYSMTGYCVVADKLCYGFVGMGVTTIPCDTRSIAYWCPEGYSGEYEFYPVMRDNILSYAESSVSTMPLRRTADGFENIGRNFIGYSELAYSDASKNMTKGNPRFAYLPEDAVIGNCTPALVTIPGSNGGFVFYYTGRYGEDMHIDAYNLLNDLEPSELAQLGGQTHEVKVVIGDEVVCAGADSFNPWFPWPETGYVEATISTHNVLIDDKVPGDNTATLSFDTGSRTVPTLTSLQIRGLHDEQVDRLGGSFDGYVEMTAAVFTLGDITRGFARYDYSDPSEVVFEYSPHGYDSFEELTVAEVPELFFLPGYGKCLRVNLEDIQSESPDMWYDFRITVKGDNGAVQTQTISPAIHIGKLGLGVKSVMSEGTVADTSVYNLQGIHVADSLNGLPEGTYITGGRKVVVR